MEIISKNIETTLNNKGWDDVNRNGFFIVLYKDEIEFNVWADYCSHIDENIDPYEAKRITLLCIASQVE